jgi:serine phosphatase RsbU (regulator of sigma subunit)
MDASTSIRSRSTLLRATLRPDEASLHVRTIEGPVRAGCDLLPGKVVLVGREASCDLELAHESVSRRHARIAVVGGEWTVTDLGSLNGTRVCGQALRPEAPSPIGPGDTLEFGACVLRVGPRGSTGTPTLALPSAPSRLRIAFHSQAEVDVSSREHVQRLTAAAVALGAATTIEQAGQVAVDALLASGGLGMVALVVLEQGTGEGEPIATVVRTRGSGGANDSTVAPAGGAAGESSGESSGGSSGVGEHAALITAAASLADATRFATVSREGAGFGAGAGLGAGLKTGLVAAAAPVMSGGRVVAVLLGAWEQGRSGGGASAIGGDPSADVALLLGVAQACGLATSRMQAARVQQRLAALAQQLESARRAQSALLPAARGRVGGVRYSALFRPGEYVAGDFYDIVPTRDGRVACILGDVCGHGLASGLYMASLLTHLRDRLAHESPLLDAIASANALLARLNGGAQRSGGTFVLASLWACVVDPATGQAECADCGHGYAAIMRAGSGDAELLSVRGGPPLGVAPEERFGSSVVTIERADTLVLFSDGVVEQPDPGTGEQFGLGRLADATRGLLESDAITAAVERAITRFAGIHADRSFQDDVTVLALGRAEG